MRIFKKSNFIKNSSKENPSVAGTTPTKKVELWGNIAKVGIYLLVFLVPLFFLPWTVNTLDFNKQALVGVFVLVILLAWIMKVLVSARLELNFSTLSIPVLILLLVCTISTIFSLWPYGSFWGWPQNISASLVTLLYFVVLYFLILNIFAPAGDKKQQQAEEGIFWLLCILVFSGFLSVLFCVLQLFGKFILPWDFTKSLSFNTAGTINSLAVFSAILIPLAITLILVARKLMKVFLIISALLVLALLILVNFWVAWVVVIGGAIVLFIFGMSNLRAGPKNMQLIQFCLAILIIASFFIFFKPSVPNFLPQPPLEVFLKQKPEITIAKNTLGERALLGTGPGTFIYDFVKFKPKELNQTVFWNIRFGAGASEVLDKLITTGILGIISLVLIFGMFFWKGLQCLTLAKNSVSGQVQEKTINLQDEISWFLKLGVFTSFVVVVLSQFLYSANFSLVFIFWLMLAFLAAFDRKRIKSWEIPPASPLAVGVSFVLILVLIFSAGFSFISAQKYIAEVDYFQGLKSWQESQLSSDLSEKERLTNEAVRQIEEAIRLNPNSDIYWRDLSQLYLLKLNVLFQRQDLSQEERASQGQALIRGAVNSAKQATDLNPENVANWNVRGFIYSNMAGVLGGGVDWALTSYQKATELEPTNPYLFTEIGRVYVAKADLKEGTVDENLKLAREKFEKSLELKNDYAPAHFQIALIYVKEGKIKEAEEKLETAKQLAPLDAGLGFQLGVLYYQDNQFDKAKVEFERAIGLDDNYSNARYLLGLIYDKEGKKNDAILQFEKIEKLNPNNEEIKKILGNLRAGKLALEGIQPAQPPIEEKPEEIEKK